jgi:acyl carrier protein
MTSMQTEIRQFIIDNFLFGQSDKPFANGDSFLENGIIDSTGVLELIAFLEERFQIPIEDQDLVPANLDSVDQIVAFVTRKQGAGANVS